jgi:hypothetical protein
MHDVTRGFGERRHRGIMIKRSARSMADINGEEKELAG